MMANFDDLFTTPAAPEPPSALPQLTKEEYAAKKKAERDDLYALADEMAHEIMQDGDAFRGFLDQRRLSVANRHHKGRQHL